MGLGKYFRKRSFSKTPEPKGSVKKTNAKRLSFVIQEHHASQLHYDFRLELDGVLKSWAVPKGPSLDPHDKHLAVHVEDHPYEYRKFEGVIPEGNYGAGNVIIWDEGWYEPRAAIPAGKDAEDVLRKGYKDEHLTFILHGKKLRGEFALIKMHGQDEDAWLLVKKEDEFASAKDVTKQDQSVKTGRKVDDLGGKFPDLSSYPKVAKPWSVKPMLCTLVNEPFNGDEWLFEVKWDGYRAIGTKCGSDIELYSRATTDFKEHYPPVVEALHELKHDVILDGEIVVIDDDGTPHFAWLQQWRKVPQGALAYYVFDILWCDGHDVRDMPLVERKQLLQKVIPQDSIIRYSDDVQSNGVALFEQMRVRGLEGVVAKKAQSAYAENNRGSAWLKIKTHKRQEVVIGGFTEPRGSRSYLGALIVGVYEGDNFIYVGHSGGGIPDSQRKQLREKLEKIERKTSPFTIEPKPNAPVHWVKPELVCEMNFAEWTKDGSMRQPKFVGMRADKKPKEVQREKEKSTTQVKSKAMTKQPEQRNSGTVLSSDCDDESQSSCGGAESSRSGSLAKLPFELTHADKIFFPRHKYTKGDLIEYYQSVAEYINPYLKDRPLSLLRQPNGITGEGFFQKNHEHLPDWVPSTNIFSESNNKDLHWIVGGELATLLYIVQLGSIEVNPWNSRVGHLDNPDWIVIDLDPEGRTFKEVVIVAKTVHEVCQEWGVDAYPKTSGKTGIHIFIPMQAKYTYEQAKNFAHLIVLEVNKRQPKITSLERMPDKRKNRIYLDFLQNRQGQTLAAPYSVRPTPDATVAAPLYWSEVTPSLRPTDFTIKNMVKRLEKEGDLWKPVMGKGVDIEAVLKKIDS